MSKVSIAHENEAFLIAQAQEGSRDAFNQLTERYYQRMYRVALRVVRHPQDAEDVTQEVFISMLRKLKDFRGQAALSTWLTSVTFNAAVNYLRRKKRLPASLDELAEDQPGEIQDALARGNTFLPADESYARNETRSVVQKGLRSLKPTYRIPMELRVVDDLSIEEISRRLKLPVGTVKVQLFRGRRALREYLEPRLPQAA